MYKEKWQIEAIKKFNELLDSKLPPVKIGDMSWPASKAFEKISPTDHWKAVQNWRATGKITVNWGNDE